MGCGGGKAVFLNNLLSVAKGVANVSFLSFLPFFAFFYFLPFFSFFNFHFFSSVLFFLIRLLFPVCPRLCGVKNRVHSGANKTLNRMMERILRVHFHKGKPSSRT